MTKTIENLETTPEWVVKAKYKSILQVVLAGNDWKYKYPLLEALVDRIISLRDKELMESIKKVRVKVWNLDDKEAEVALYAIRQTKDSILSILSTHNKEN